MFAIAIGLFSVFCYTGVFCCVWFVMFGLLCFCLCVCFDLFDCCVLWFCLFVLLFVTLYLVCFVDLIVLFYCGLDLGVG